MLNDDDLVFEAAAFGRLCVETTMRLSLMVGCRAAAFGRLCVETALEDGDLDDFMGSRLRAAVC